jgi:AcrR family transcriptional regulator
VPTKKRVSMKAIRKDEIMQAALTVLSERGSTNVTLDDIAKASGFSKGGITYYYSSKDALIKDVFEYFFSDVYKRADAETGKKDTPLEKILSYVWLYDRNDDQCSKIYPLLFDVLVLATNNDEYRASIQKWVHSWLDQAVKILEEGNSIGDFHIEDIQGTAMLISAIAQGIGTRWFLDKDSHTTEWAQKAYTQAIIATLNMNATTLSDQMSVIAKKH